MRQLALDASTRSQVSAAQRTSGAASEQASEVAGLRQVVAAPCAVVDAEADDRRGLLAPAAPAASIRMPPILRAAVSTSRSFGHLRRQGAGR